MRYALPVITLAALGLVAIAWWSDQETVTSTEFQGASQTPHPEQSDATPTEPPAATAEGLPDPPPQSVALEVTKGGAESAAANTNLIAPPPPPPPMALRYRRDVSQAQQWSAEDLREAVGERGDLRALDGETLYQASLFVRSCQGHSSDPAQLAQQLSQYESWHERDPEGFSADQLSQAVEAAEKGFMRCDGLEEDSLYLAFDLLEMAALRGYPVAQLEFPSAGQEMISRDPDWPFRQPEIVLRYRETVMASVAGGLATGMSEMLMVQAILLHEGWLGEPDAVNALAYAYAAERADLDLPSFLDDPQSLIDHMATDHVSNDERDYARGMARDLCERYC